MAIGSDALAIGLDLGGSKVAGGVIDGRGTVVQRLEVRPNEAATTQAVLDNVLGIVAGLRKRHDVAGIGIGVAGFVDWPGGRVRWSPSPGYDGVELRRLVADATGVPVVVDNDANVTAWGEAYPGGDEYLAMLCVGSGLGGGFVLGGEVYRGATGIAAEIAHLPAGGTEICGCGCGLAGGLVTLATGTALERAAARVARSDPDGLIARLGTSGRAVTEAARLGDPKARELFAELGRALGKGAAVLTALLDLRRVVVGGGLVAAGDLFLDDMRESMRRFIFPREHRELPTVTLARLGPDAGWVGAGLLAVHETRRQCR